MADNEVTFSASAASTRNVATTDSSAPAVSPVVITSGEIPVSTLQTPPITGSSDSDETLNGCTTRAITINARVDAVRTNLRRC